MAKVLMIGAGGVATVAAFKIVQNADVFTEFMIAHSCKRLYDAYQDGTGRCGRRRAVEGSV